MEFDPGARGWCYILEEHGLSKGDFDYVARLIGDCRKNGMLPIDFTGDDDVGREFVHVEQLDEFGPEGQAQRVVDFVDNAHKQYDPLSLWEFQDSYVELLVEKVGLRSLFAPVCDQYHVPLGNTKGSPSIIMRVKMLRRFARWQAEGKQCVLLYCGDHDIHGMRISTALRSNLADVLPAFCRKYPEWGDFDLDAVVIERFGLNADFIKRHRLSWTANLVTGGGKDLGDAEHPYHHHRDVQAYIKQHGRKKVEADALVTRPQAGRALCEAAILRYVDEGGIKKHERAVKRERKQMRVALDRMLGR